MNTETKYELRPIVGFEGLYSVSNAGEVFSHNYHSTGKTQELRQIKDKDGYLKVSLSQDGKAKQYRVHRLVLQAFKPNPDNKLECDHIDTNRANNHISNLRWTTRAENSNNPVTLKNIGVSGRDKTVYKFRNKSTGEVFVGTQYDFYTKFNLYKSAVSNLIHGKYKSTNDWVLFT